jgi:hypothetical protein
MDTNTEIILIVHSVAKVVASQLQQVKEAIRTFTLRDSSVQCEPLVFEVPTGAALGATLGTELTRELRSCIGAVVFVDELRPNVAYELGFFHGRGRTVLLITNRQVDSAWAAISDLSGAAVHRIENGSLRSVVHSYLTRLYGELSSMPPWPLSQLPSEEHNLIRNLPEVRNLNAYQPTGEWGASLRVSAWGPLDIRVGFNLLADAGFKIVLRALEYYSHGTGKENCGTRRDRG